MYQPELLAACVHQDLLLLPRNEGKTIIDGQFQHGVSRNNMINDVLFLLQLF